MTVAVVLEMPVYVLVETSIFMLPAIPTKALTRVSVSIGIGA